MSKVEEIDKNVEIWRLKKLIKTLQATRSNDRSMISLIIPAHAQISRVAKMLDDLKTDSDYQSALGAITSALETLEYYNTSPPPNGLALYTGSVVTDDGNVEKFTTKFEPFKPIKASYYGCGYKFHTAALNVLLDSDDMFGFIVMDEKGTLFGRSSGNTSEVLHESTADLGGQMQDLQSYLRKNAELVKQCFINPDTSQANVSGLILAVSADLKFELSQSKVFAPRLEPEIMKVVEVSCGGKDGFTQAIKRANVKFIQEELLLRKFMVEMKLDNERCVIGGDATIECLQMGAVEILVVWEDLDMDRYKLKNSTTNESFYKHLSKHRGSDRRNFRDSTGAELIVEEKVSLLEWLAKEYKNFGCRVEFVSDRSIDGARFCRGLLGIGGILRYEVDFNTPYDDGTDDATRPKKVDGTPDKLSAFVPCF